MNSFLAATYPHVRPRLQPLQGRTITVLLLMTQAAFVVFLSAGHFKANPGLAWVPFDLTVASGCVVLLLSILSFLATGEKIRLEVLWMIVFFAAMAISALWTEWTPYAFEKATRFYTLSFLAAVLPAFILNGLAGTKRFVGFVIVFGILVSSGVLLEFVQGGFSGGLAGRTAGFATVTTALGRDAGEALVGLYACMLRGGRWLWLSLICVPLFLALVASGSRGPLFFTVLVLAFLTLRFSRQSRLGVAIALLLLAAAVSTYTGYSSWLPQGSVRRIGAVLEGRNDRSAEERQRANLAAIDAIVRNPFGLGFGGFAREYNFGNATDRVYPHNLVLEVAVENGLFVAALLVFIIGISVRRSYRAAVSTPELQPFFALLLLVLCNTIVSGELNIDRLVYALIATGLQIPALQEKSGASVPQAANPSGETAEELCCAAS